MLERIHTILAGLAWHGQVEHENENENDTWAGEETKTADGPVDNPGTWQENDSDHA